MKKKILCIFVLVFLFLFTLVGCGDKPTNETIDKIHNDYGVVIEKDDFDPKTIVCFGKITDEKIRNNVEAILANQEYNKDADIMILDVYLSLNGEKIQPNKEVTVIIPAKELNIDNTKEYLLFHIKDDNSVEALKLSLDDNNLKFNTTSFSYFVLVQKNDSTTHKHSYGSMYYERPATFFDDGNIAYYYCEECGKYFDENKKEVDSVVIPKLSTDIVLLVNGTKVADFVLSSSDENHINWALTGINLKKDDLIEVADKADNTKKYDYFVNTSSNITEEFKVHNDADSASISIYCTLNGLQLSISGFEYDGITVKVKREEEVSEYPMSEIEYNFGTPINSYIYGYLYLEKDDVIEVYDHENDKSYGFSYVNKEDLWNTFLFSESSDNKILINKNARIGVEFDNNTNVIYIDAAYESNDGSSYSLDVYGKDPISMIKNVYQSDSDEYKTITYIMNHDATINNSDIIEALNKNGLVTYSVTADLKANDKIRIKNDSKNTYVKNDHLFDLYGFTSNLTAVEFDGDYIKVLEDAKYLITYMECVDGFVIEKMGALVNPDAKVQLNISSTNPDSGLVVLTKNESNSNVYEIKNKELLVSDVFSIIYNGNNYAYSDIEVGQDLVKSIASGGYAFLMPKVAGTYNISFNVQTLKLTIVLVEEKTENVLVSCKLYDSKNMNTMTLEGEEFKYTLTVSPGMYFGFIDQDANSVDDFKLSEPYDTSVITMLGSMIYIIGNANVTVYIHRTTHVVRVVVNG